DPRARCSRERRHDASRVLALRLARRERAVDGGELIRVDRELAGESVPAGTRELALETPGVAKVSVHPVDRLHSEGRRGQQARAASQLEGEGQDRKSTRLNSSHQIMS